MNTFKGRTYAINATPARCSGSSRDRARSPRRLRSRATGDRLVHERPGGGARALERARSSGADLPGAKVESSAVVIGKTAYFGATDGRLFAVNVDNGHIRWAYDTGGRINSSPSILGNKIFITTYAGSILSLNRLNGHRNWITYIRRDLRSTRASTRAPRPTEAPVHDLPRREGRRGARFRRLDVWTHELSTTGYSTPAIANGRIYVGDFNGLIHCLPGDGRDAALAGLHRRPDPRPGRGRRPARVLLQPGDEDFGLRRSDGKIVWRVGMGKYQPGIATDRHYYFTLNGLLVAYQGSDVIKKAARVAAAKRANDAKRAKQHSRRDPRPVPGEARPSRSGSGVLGAVAELA